MDDDRWLRDTLKWVNSPEFRRTAEMVRTAQRRQRDLRQIQEIAADATATAELARNITVWSEYTRLVALRAEHKRTLRAATAATALQPAVDQLLRGTSTYRSGVERAVGNQQFAAAVISWVTGLRSLEPTHASTPISDPAIPQHPQIADPGDLAINVSELEAIADSDALDSLDLGLLERELEEAGRQDATLSELLDAGVGGLLEERPDLARDRARQLFFVFIVVVWTSGIVVLNLAADSPVLKVITAALGALGVDSIRVATKIDEQFDDPDDFV